MEFRQTRHQVARGARADVETSEELLLFKFVSFLRLTYQIRLLTFQASELKKKLVVEVPAHCEIDLTLREFVKAHRQFIKIKRI